MADAQHALQLYVPALPDEVLRLIFAHCEGATLLASARGVCRAWRALVNEAAQRPWAKAVLGASLSAPTVAWTEADCTALLDAEGVNPRRAPCVLSAAARMDSFWPPPLHYVTAAQAALLSSVRAERLIARVDDDAPDAAPVELCAALCALTGLSVGAAGGGLAAWAAAALSRPGLGFWASAALVFLLAQHGRAARLTARWLHGLPFPAADELRHCLAALLAHPAWDCAGVRSLAADWRTVASPALDACLPAAPRGVLTAEQAAVVSAPLAPGATAKVIAFAGAGKTHTLRALAAAHPDWRCLYTAYNKALISEAEASFAALSNVTCATTHSLALAATRPQLQRRRGADGRPRKQFCASGIPPWQARQLLPGHTQPVITWALKAVDTFLVTDDADVAQAHLPDRTAAAEAVRVLALARQVARRMLDPEDDFPFTHNAYLRRFVLSEPRLPYHCILVDEAQDINPITLRLLTAQAHAVRVFVGDTHQHIYAFNGTRNALATLPAQHTFRLTRSFRFGAELAAAADKILFWKGETVPLRGARGIATALHAADTPQAPPGGGRVAAVVRKNATWVSLAANVAEAGATIHVVTPQEAANMLQKAEDLYLVSVGRAAEASDRRMHHWRSLQQAADAAEDADDVPLLSLCSFVQRAGLRVPALLAAIRAAAVVNPDSAAVLFATCHKAKGLEFDAVAVCTDLCDAILSEPTCERTGQVHEALHDEVNLLYVALTRARRHVTLPHALVAALDTYAHLQRVPADADDEALARLSCAACAQLPTAGEVLLMLPPTGGGGARVSCRRCCVAGAAPRRAHGAHLAALLVHLSSDDADAPAAG